MLIGIVEFVGYIMSASKVLEFSLYLELVEGYITVLFTEMFTCMHLNFEIFIYFEIKTDKPTYSGTKFVP